MKMMEPADCARIILRGVARNKGIIPIRASTRLLWWLYRLSPALFDWVGRRMVRGFRASLVEQ